MARSKRKSTRKRRSAMQDFDPDYSYIKKDLRRIAILAGTFITSLVILSFFLNG